MSITKLKKLNLSLTTVLALSTGLAISACSAESANEATQYSVQSIENSDSRDFESVYAEANQGDPQAQFQLGSMYENGEGVSQDKTKAADWYRKSAEQGFADGQNALAKLYYFIT
uniref:tetratricopeptide repeat protein n=1 Tax=Psychrobacter sp. HII-4 TaxID=1569264 RepID=UPI002A0A34FA